MMNGSGIDERLRPARGVEQRLVAYREARVIAARGCAMPGLHDGGELVEASHTDESGVDFGNLPDETEGERQLRHSGALRIGSEGTKRHRHALLRSEQQALQEKG